VFGVGSKRYLAKCQSDNDTLSLSDAGSLAATAAKHADNCAPIGNARNSFAFSPSTFSHAMSPNFIALCAAIKIRLKRARTSGEQLSTAAAILLMSIACTMSTSETSVGLSGVIGTSSTRAFFAKGVLMLSMWRSGGVVELGLMKCYYCYITALHHKSPDGTSDT
jgi:hypothetical protein